MLAVYRICNCAFTGGESRKTREKRGRGEKREGYHENVDTVKPGSAGSAGPLQMAPLVKSFFHVEPRMNAVKAAKGQIQSCQQRKTGFIQFKH